MLTQFTPYLAEWNVFQKEVIASASLPIEQIEPIELLVEHHDVHDGFMQACDL